MWQQRSNFLAAFADCDHLCVGQEAPSAALCGGTGGYKAARLCRWAAHPDQPLDAFALRNYTLQVLAGDVTRLSKQVDYCFINTVECTYNKITSLVPYTSVFLLRRLASFFNLLSTISPLNILSRSPLSPRLRDANQTQGKTVYTINKQDTTPEAKVSHPSYYWHVATSEFQYSIVMVVTVEGRDAVAGLHKCTQ